MSIDLGHYIAMWQLHGTRTLFGTELEFQADRLIDHVGFVLVAKSRTSIVKRIWINSESLMVGPRFPTRCFAPEALPIDLGTLRARDVIKVLVGGGCYGYVKGQVYGSPRGGR